MAQSLSKRGNLPPSEVPCKFFRSGVCRRGSTCWFKHESSKSPQLNPRRDASASVMSSVRKQAEVDEWLVSSESGDVNTRDESSSEADTLTTSVVSESPYKGSPREEEEVEKCAICLEEPTVFGLLLNCDHVFCLPCMREWRVTSGMATRELTASGSETETAETVTRRPDRDAIVTDSLPLRAERRRIEVRLNKCCPLCRTPSDFIVPSSQLPAKSTAFDRRDQKSGEQTKQLTKQEIVDTYLATLKHIPCKYFASTRSCQFGNDCHYAHRVPAQKPKRMSASGRSSTYPEAPRRQAATGPYREYVFTPQELQLCASRFRRLRLLEYTRIDRDEGEQIADEHLFYDRLDMQDDLSYDFVPAVFDVNPRDSVEPDPILIISEHISRLRALILERHGN
ncbi:hypothetical protein POJ06DRAFT_244971 [Lipomyces tetrasporus]|uniref:RING-type E3 ubiquitin transferase n=1 Tax=Lipomyces tetrasporus TaxID=54092 RepID=A0AAD7QX64_9ASCO|nr:uncharacterized protein POJ06DRAFT_244971 [Lipomyces tetrasporus]KAJ8102546.1 hypothetical protein POJ06DRAFT_244971 [Lipomyces tetrasporus]